MKSNRKSSELKGIVHRLDPINKPNAGDVDFSPDSNVTNTIDGVDRSLRTSRHPLLLEKSLEQSPCALAMKR